jgi:hypothetical protein
VQPLLQGVPDRVVPADEKIVIPRWNVERNGTADPPNQYQQQYQKPRKKALPSGSSLILLVPAVLFHTELLLL